MHHLLIAFAAALLCSACSTGPLLVQEEPQVVVAPDLSSPFGEAFRTVGEVELKAGETVTVEVSNHGTQGFVILDALQFESR